MKDRITAYDKSDRHISLNDNQIEIIADLFSKRESLLFGDQDAEWLLSHAFQQGMKTYKKLIEP
jgi:hypothetical protein